jgi:hypothetical protein
LGLCALAHVVDNGRHARAVAGEFMHACEGEAVCKLANEKARGAAPACARTRMRCRRRCAPPPRALARHGALFASHYAHTRGARHAHRLAPRPTSPPRRVRARQHTHTRAVHTLRPNQP